MRLVHHAAGVVDVLRIHKAGAHGQAHGLEEGVRHAAADDDRVALVDQVVDDADLILDLRAAEDRDQRALGILERAAHELDLLLDQKAHGGGQELGDAAGGGVRAVRGAERVVHVEVGKGSVLP